MIKKIVFLLMFCSINIFAAPQFNNFMSYGSAVYDAEEFDRLIYFEDTLLCKLNEKISLLALCRSDDYQFWSGRQYALGCVYKLAPKTTLDLRYNRGHDSSAVDSYGYSWEIDQNVAGGIDLLLGYKIITYQYNDVQIGTLGYIQYFTDRNWLVMKYFGSIDTFLVRSGSCWLQYTQLLSKEWDIIIGGTTGSGYDTQNELLLGEMNYFYSKMLGFRYYCLENNSLMLKYEEMTKKDFYTRKEGSIVWQTKF